MLKKKGNRSQRFESPVKCRSATNDAIRTNATSNVWHESTRLFLAEVEKNHYTSQMLAILYSKDCKTVAEETAADLAKAYDGHLHPELIQAESPISVHADPAWDDLLIIMYDGAAFPAKGDEFVQEYISKRKSPLMLPVALDPAARKPPTAAAEVKAMVYDAACKGVKGRLVNRIGAMLGLRVHKRDTQIFISYRATDGASLANQIHAHFKTLGYIAFLDEAQELDGETRILPGSAVQKEIDEALEKTSLVLLLDTPDAPASPWIAHEVKTAVASLIPVLPVTFRVASDKRKGPRFASLIALQRWVQLELPDGSKPLPDLQTPDLDDIVAQMEDYLCDIFQRKSRVPALVEKEFLSHGYNWDILNKKLLMFQSSKGDWRLKTVVVSHCSIFDQVYIPSISRFGLFLKDVEPKNHSLFIYDGDLLTEPQLKDIVAAHTEPVIILHHQELATLIDSNFTKLAAA